jgi:transcriptional regulator with XRE-family HTH domain
MGEERRTEAIGARVRASRKRRGYSREELAVRAGLSWSAIAQIESGRRANVRPATLAGLADALGVNIDYLVAGAGVRPLLVHRAAVYEGEAGFADVVGRMLAEGAEAGEKTVAVLAPGRVEIAREVLGSADGEVHFCEAAEIYKHPVAAVTRFGEILGEHLASGAPWVRLVGEPPLAGGPASEWVRCEALLNLAFAAWPVTMICGYDSAVVGEDGIRDAHATHPETVSAAGLAASESYSDPAIRALASE